MMSSSRAITTIAARGFRRMSVLSTASSPAAAASVGGAKNGSGILDDRYVSADSKLKQYILLNFSNKNYQSWEDVPSMVTSCEMNTAKSRLQIHINLWCMLVGTAICFAVGLHYKRQHTASWTAANEQKYAQWAREHKQYHDLSLAMVPPGSKV